MTQMILAISARVTVVLGSKAPVSLPLSTPRVDMTLTASVCWISSASVKSLFAAAKMLLVAMGYDSEIFNFTGADWEINVNRQANEAKLYEEIKSIDTSAGLSRDNTAQT